MIIDVGKFAEQERPFWQELEDRLRKLEEASSTEVSFEDAQRTHYLYERASADLAKIQTFSAEPELRRYLDALVARAYGELHSGARRDRSRSLLAWFFGTWPRTFRQHGGAFAMALGVTLVGAAFGWFALELDPEAREILMPFHQLLVDPSQRVAHEERATQDPLRGMQATFSAHLMQNNIRVSLLALALGITCGLGTIVLLFYNGVILGAVALDYVRAGETRFLMGWLLPHGVVEIPAMLMAGQAGLVLAAAVLGRGSRGRLSGRLREGSRDLFTLAGGVAILLVWAGIVEAFLSQYHEPVLPYSLKIAFGLMELCALVGFLSFSGRGAQKSAARKGSE